MTGIAQVDSWESCEPLVAVLNAAHTGGDRFYADLFIAMYICPEQGTALDGHHNLEAFEELKGTRGGRLEGPTIGPTLGT